VRGIIFLLSWLEKSKENVWKFYFTEMCGNILLQPPLLFVAARPKSWKSCYHLTESAYAFEVLYHGGCRNKDQGGGNPLWDLTHSR